jgi:hypothetical protein
VIVLRVTAVVGKSRAVKVRAVPVEQDRAGQDQVVADRMGLDKKAQAARVERDQTDVAPVVRDVVAPGAAARRRCSRRLRESNCV